MTRPLYLAMVTAVLATAPTTVHGAPAQVGVMPLQFEGDVSPEDQALLEQALLGALAAEQIEVRPIETRCADAACVSEQAAAHQVARIVDTTVAFDTNDYHLTLAVLDPSGNTVRSVQLSCEICTVPDMESRFAKAAADLREQLIASTTTVRVESTPAGAAVSIDGTRRGVTPLQLEIAAGPHQLRVEREGYQVAERSLEVREGELSELSLTLTPAGDRAPARRKSLWLTGFGLLGGGAAAAIGGAVMLGIDSRPIQRKCEGNNIDINGECRYLHDTRMGGVVALAVGGAALVAGVTLVVLGRKGGRKKPGEQARRPRLRPSLGGVEVTF